MNRIIYNYRIKRILYEILESRAFQKNFLYKKALRRQISAVQKKHRITPYCVRIENTNICNASCSICPRDRLTRTQGLMDSWMYEDIIEQCAASGVEYVNLHNFGEPLVDPGFAAKVRFAKEQGIAKVTTNTNASLLNPAISKALIQAGLDELYVSLDAVEPETYKRVRRGLDFEVVVRNLESFLVERARLEGKTKLIVSFVQSADNYGEISRFIRFWRGRADHVSISFAHDWIGSKPNIEARRFATPCRLLFTDLNIAWNGDYLLCCADFNGDVKLGNFMDMSLEQFWKSPALAAIRAAHLTGRAEEYRQCALCTMNTYWWF